jgi:hypothetical protein
MPNPTVEVNLRAKSEPAQEKSEVNPSVGGSMKIDLGDAETTWSVDYMKPDRLVLTIEGKARLIETENIRVDGGGQLTRDFFAKSTALEGNLRMEFSKNVSVKLTAASDSRGGRVGASLTLEF